MPARLVYAPKCWVYTKDGAGNLYNLSNYVTAGNVVRLVDQASTASVTLRNPQMKFTANATAGSAAFHPMDPITIYLERLSGFPVRVFTGYLDDTPYWQMYPGTITLSATCTLKRLLYTWFDPSLPYVIAFLEANGWTNTGQGSIISTQAYGSATVNTPGVTQSDLQNGVAQAFGNLQDGSIGKLLWATLYQMADWQDTQIYIEALPDGIPARMAALIADIENGEQTAANELSTFLSAVIGSGSQGTGGGTATGSAATGGSSAGVPSGSQADAQSLMSYLVAHNFSVNAAAGVCGSIGGAEDTNWSCATKQGGTQTTLAEASGVGYGLCQWTYSSLQAGLAALAASMNQPASNVAVQYAYIVQSLTTGYASLLTAMNNAATPADAATLFASQYENPQDLPATITARQNAATQYAASYTTGTSATSANPLPSLIPTTTQPGVTTGAAATSAPTTETRYTSCIQAANTIDKANLPYSWGGGHPQVGVPSQGGNSDGGGGQVVTGFDCSGSVAAVLAAAGIYSQSSVPADAGVISNLQTDGVIVAGLDSGSDAVNIFDNPGSHIFMEIGGHFFGTTDASGHMSAGSNQGAGWLTGGELPSATSGFNTYHVMPSVLTESNNYSYTLASGVGSTTLPANAGSAATNVVGNANAQAFVDSLTFPSVEDQVIALALGTQHKGLMHDQSIMPFVQQLTQGSLRSFMSLPNGDFYAFYPDYFGEFGQHNPYWLIDDIEVTNGGIGLSDAPLCTHYFVVGDNTWPVNDELLNDLVSSGAITIFNAFLSSGLIDTSALKASEQFAGGMADIMSQAEAIDFIKRYGARPIVNQYPMVRSSIMEMFLAYQGFMTAWSNQFLTPFEFTFMPELFPGGKVGFPKHGLQMYVQSVTHTWDLEEAGFTTTAQLAGPALMSGANSQQNHDLPPYMVQALVEPIRPDTNSAPNSENGTRTTQTTNVLPSAAVIAHGTGS